VARFHPLIKTPPYLTAAPDISHHQKLPNDPFLIIASDGVWGLKDVIDKWVVITVQEGIEKGVDPAAYMIKEIRKFRPGDDVSIIVIVLFKKQENQALDKSTE
jgi:serine/threonine protein phosphatase PrpC